MQHTREQSTQLELQRQVVDIFQLFAQPLEEEFAHMCRRKAFGYKN